MTTLKDAPAGTQEFVISRVVDAPLKRVWQAWTDPGQLAKWWGPKGFSATVARLELQPGGVFHYCLRSAEGQEMWGKFIYREIVPEQRLVFITSFSDATGGIARHPLEDSWPLQLLSTVTFADENGKTRVTVTWVPYAATKEERATFEARRDAMQRGWTGTMDQLDALLGKVGV